MEQINHEQLAKLLTIKNKTNIAINNKIFELLQDTLIEAISQLIDSPKQQFSDFDAFYKDEVLVVYLQNTIDDQVYSVKIGIPIDIVFKSPEFILQFMKQQIDEYQQESDEDVINHTLSEHNNIRQDIQFDETQLTDCQKQQLKYATKYNTRH